MIIAIVGLPGSGKTEATKHFIEAGYQRIHFGQIVFDEVKKRGLELNEANERIVREDLRKIHGMAAMAILSLPKIKELHKKGNVALESFYSWEEYKLIKEKFGDDFKVLAVCASPALRHARLLKRPFRPCTPEEAKSRDYSQIENLHQAGPIAMADYTVSNEGSLEELKEKVKLIIEKLKT